MKLPRLPTLSPPSGAESPRHAFPAFFLLTLFFILPAAVHAQWEPDRKLSTTDSSACTNENMARCLLSCGDTLHAVWYDVQNNGSAIYYKRNLTGNSGVEVFPPASSRLTPYEVFPNPFTSFAAVPGHGREVFSLYDVSGRKVGTYQGDRIGEGLSAGVYFLRSAGGSSRPLRIVKVR